MWERGARSCADWVRALVQMGAALRLGDNAFRGSWRSRGQRRGAGVAARARRSQRWPRPFTITAAACGRAHARPPTQPCYILHTYGPAASLAPASPVHNHPCYIPVALPPPSRRPQVTRYVGPFCLVAPASILLGVYVGAVAPALSLLFSCFATGTFIYVGASEVRQPWARSQGWALGAGLGRAGLGWAGPGWDGMGWDGIGWGC